MTNAVEKVQAAPLTHSERFVNKVMTEFNGTTSMGLEVTDYQRQLIQGYFIGIDRALKLAEANRIAKNEKNKDHKWDNMLEAKWENVNLNDLALDVVHYARMGLDMMQKNFISAIPFKNNKTGKYDIALMPGYNGIQYVAERYALDKPISVITELVYSTDTFKPIKRSASHEIESYEFEINNPFARGDLMGGFGYIMFDDPRKNKLIFMSMADIQKRKPQYASAEFWGGDKTVWNNGKQEVTRLDGWLPEMCLKTIRREVYSEKNILRDPKKIDDNYQYMKQREMRYAEMAVEDEIQENANTLTLDFDHETGEILSPAVDAEMVPPVESAAAPVEDDLP